MFASIDGSTVNAGDHVTVSATANATIDTQSRGIAGALGGGVGAGIALSGAGAASLNSIADTVEASIRNSTVLTTHAVDVTASDSSKITAAAGALAVSIGVGGGAGVAASLGASVAVNRMQDVTIAGALRHHAIRATIDNSTVGNLAVQSGAVTVHAESTGTIQALTLAGSASAAGGVGAGMGFAGAGAFSRNLMGGTTEALIVGGSQIRRPARASRSRRRARRRSTRRAGRPRRPSAAGTAAAARSASARRRPRT